MYSRTQFGSGTLLEINEIEENLSYVMIVPKSLNF